MEIGSSPQAPTAAERVIITVLSTLMLLVPVAEITVRATTGNGIAGSGVYVQHFTLWLGFIGALMATAAGSHLGLATTNLLTSARARDWAHLLSAIVAATTTVLLAYASTKVVIASSEGHETLVGGIPQWWSETIVPVTVGLIALRFIWYAPWKWRGRLITALACAATVSAYAFGFGPMLFWPAVIVIGLAFLLGTPVFIAMSAVAMLLFFREDTPIASVPTETLRLVQNPTLPAIPLLTLAGYLLAAGKASERMVRAFKSLFGWMPGGVALMVIAVCAIFTTFTGGSGVTILALGGLLLPALTKDGYPEGFSIGLVTAAGSLGLLFQPSLPVFLYSAVAGVSADSLFTAGALPGLLLIIVVAVYGVYIGIKSKAARQPFNGAEVGRAFWGAKFDLLLPIVVIVPFKAGWCTIVEAAALGATYATLVELIIFRDVHPTRDLPRVMAQSATLVGAVVILMGVALGFTSYLVDAQFPDALVEWTQKHFHSQWTFLLGLNGMLLILGSVFEIYAAIIVLAPLVAPLGQVFNVDPVHLGVVFLANLELGFLFPPMGLNLFLSASRFNKPLPYLYKRALPFLLILAVGVLVITYVPAITIGVVQFFNKSN